MTDRPPHVYVIQGRGQRDYADCQAALAHVPARMTTLPFIGDEVELIAAARDADALVVSATPVTRGAMSALEGLKVVVRTGVGYDVIATPHAAYFSSPAVAQVPRRCGEEAARVLIGKRPLNVVNPEVYAPGAALRAR